MIQTDAIIVVMSLRSITIRDADDADLPGMFEIYNEQVLRGTSTFETDPYTTRDRQLEWLRSHKPPRHPVTVAIDGDRVVGLASLSHWSPRQAYARAAENSVYVHADHRGRGIARALMQDLIARARAAGIGLILARIVEANPASIRLHEAMGFRLVGTIDRNGEKFGRLLDVSIYALHLD